MIKKDADQKQIEGEKNKSSLFWSMFLTGGWSSFEKEWKHSKSAWRTFLLFAVPIVCSGIIILLAIAASKAFN
ncbi:hypothetical protein [Priestia koreensis]|uniref:hypothetical protein n=1 Tax=Priestia koreensis TaxID=284581 RepID=UPI001F5849B0|nr:hypothetical protein [Priestia koreensis]UNL86975.1 hypothetical protein IE339_11005 [Priestia koreensis]